MLKRARLLGLLLGLCGCTETASTPERATESADEPEANAAPGILTTDVALSPLAIEYGSLIATVVAPAGAQVAARFGVVHVSAPDQRFAIAIDVARGQLDERKQVIAENRHNQLVGYRLEEDDALLYESRCDGRSEFHVLVRVALAGTAYECTDRKGVPYSLAEAGTMLRACRSLGGARGEVP